jgi:hypothetical protein
MNKDSPRREPARGTDFDTFSLPVQRSGVIRIAATTLVRGEMKIRRG